MLKLKKQLKLLIPAVFIFISLIFIFVILLLLPKKSQASSIIPGGANVLSNFGGQILATVDCSSPLSCVPTAPEFPVCLVIRCILQTPFIAHFFQNLSDTGGDAFREEILEPLELANCPETCPLLGLEPMSCTFFCASIAGLQEVNKSPGDIAYEQYKESTGMPTPSILMALYPQNLLPACNASRPMPYPLQLLGKGLSQPGSGLYFTQPGNQVGDNCAGNYYPLMSF
ncbi:hypothetical protein COT99_04435 [Candidatus Falkowbacteria bacterium CG10_big_fil_rev_8_21_14_0_10_43_10]|uniref:Uncharacterized protein n=1 Tax=Candidatus Falkowbacteria bacterium CG10_big_fil_rev_8_21_14_0_10_43_10 TaxID=1974567 RepID=A0A2H0V140_9BACT|nr:MAG: hypothetical protein COT99_04435 [Candidatus Falkowbacteria bacterium CG10_big_fil_rev_8_21_14_0_10_43_10]